MRSSPLLRKALVVLVVVFGVAMIATAMSSAWRINDNMTTQYESKGKAIANSIAERFKRTIPSPRVEVGTATALSDGWRRAMLATPPGPSTSVRG